ncbi:hypothetical protein ACFQNF_01185 [Iodobacter arcticus]|uniref:Uncharacterized protein n=1 Tax=Iodobacter arcticus TaxID=590593 RepID=A0ABW2QX92_9NEIS
MPSEDRLSTPLAMDEDIVSLLAVLGVDRGAAVWLPFTEPTKFPPEARECHINAWLQCKYERSGFTISGWLIWHHESTRTVESHFHTIWVTETGKLVDVTPREDGEETVLFVPDPSRSIRLTDYQGKPALKTYTKVTITVGRVVSPLREALVILTTDLIYEHGLVTRENL